MKEETRIALNLMKKSKSKNEDKYDSNPTHGKRLIFSKPVEEKPINVIPEVTTEKIAIAPLKEGEDAETLRRLQPKALQKLEEILDEQLNKYDKDYSKVMAVQRQASIDILNTQIKVDENVLRKQQSDKLVQILAEVKRMKEERFPGTLIES